MIDAGAPAFRRHLEVIESLAGDVLAIGEDRPPEPRWNQDWFPRMDAAAAYAMVRRWKPSRIVEVGSGHSTRFMARAARDGGLATVLVSIDPEPRATLEGLELERVRARVQDAGRAPFDALAGGDFLFIDSSHKDGPGSDVAFLFDEVVPRLPVGVFVHVHDIFLPRDYPVEWGWRRYSEQKRVARLLEGGGWSVEWASAWIVAERTDWVRGGVLGRLPLKEGALESSLWLRMLD